KDTPIEALILNPDKLPPNTDLTLLRQKLTNIVPSVFWETPSSAIAFGKVGILQPGDAQIIHLPSSAIAFGDGGIPIISHLPELHASIVAQNAFLCIDAEPEA